MQRPLRTGRPEVQIFERRETKEDIVPDAVLKFKGDKIKVRLKEIMKQLEEAVKEEDNEKILALQKKDQGLKLALRMISERLGKRIII